MTNKEMMEKMMNTLENLDKRITALEKSSKKTSEKKSEPAKQTKKSKQTSKKSDGEFPDSLIAIFPVTDSKVNFAICGTDWKRKFCTKNEYRFKWHAVAAFIRSFGAELDKSDWTFKLSKKAMKELFSDSHHVKGTDFHFIFKSAEISALRDAATNSKVLRQDTEVFA